MPFDMINLIFCFFQKKSRMIIFYRYTLGVQTRLQWNQSIALFSELFWQLGEHLLCWNLVKPFWLLFYFVSTESDSDGVCATVIQLSKRDQKKNNNIEPTGRSLKVIVFVKGIVIVFLNILKAISWEKKVILQSTSITMTFSDLLLGSKVISTLRND